MPRLLRLLAAQAANALSYRALAAKLELTHDMVSEYIGLLQTIFLVRLLPAWRPGIAARETHAPKAYLVDSGLLAYLLGTNEKRVATDDQVTGKVLENFAVTEVLKYAEWAKIDTTAYHYRQREEEIDLVLESRSGEIAAIEVKATASVSRSDIRALQKLCDRRGRDSRQHRPLRVRADIAIRRSPMGSPRERTVDGAPTLAARDRLICQPDDIKIADLQSQLDTLAQERRELDNGMSTTGRPR